MWTDPEDLVPGNEHLLNEDFDSLGRASAIDKVLWVAKMKALITAASHGAQRGQSKNQADNIMTSASMATRVRTGSGQEHAVSEGSGVWKKERWK